MQIFTSKREKHLWSWGLIVVIAIYSTLGLAGKLTATLRDHGLLNLSFGIGFLLIIFSIVLSGLRKSSSVKEIWIGLGIVAVYGLVMVRVFVSPAERTHLIEYGIVATLIYQALLERLENGKKIPVPYLLTIVLTGILGWIDEGMQAILPNRVYDIRDVGFNSLAGIMAVASNMVLSWAQSRFRAIS